MRMKPDLFYRRLGLFGLAILLGGCGPNRSLVRKYLANSPHRLIAVFPLDTHGQKNFSRETTSLLESKLRIAGFVIADHGKVQSAFGKSKLQSGAFDATADAADLGKPLGVQAVLVGSIDQSY